MLPFVLKGSSIMLDAEKILADYEIEKTVIGTIMNNPDKGMNTLTKLGTRAEWFFHPSYRILWELFVEMRESFRPIDMASVLMLAEQKDSKQEVEAPLIKAMEDASEALSAGIARKIEHLNVIGNISPMMGLLGTVIGMLRCFNEISQATGAIEPKQLAGGIFEALITTCMGLVVAIPSLYFYALFRNRVDEITGEASLAAEELVTSFKPESLKE